MAKRTFGCSSIVNAVCLQFELAGHGLYTDIKCSRGGMWCVEHAIKRTTRLTFREQWDAQRPNSLSMVSTSGGWDVV